MTTRTMTNTAAADHRTPGADDNNSSLSSSSPPHDGTLEHAWLFEQSPGSNHAVLTTSGLEHIAAHKYVPGQCTHLDLILNPAWNYLTSLLPLWLAPNAVTTMGGLHCGLSYGILWYYSSNFDENVPDWTLALAGYCTLAYYTLDCMDGKQARRTGASSPLGQLFDHGFDCLSLHSHLASAGAYAMCGGTKWLLLLQFILQFSFYVAQWEEYYTRTLPHSTSDWFGVTEGVYGLGLLTLAMSFIDRTAFWIRPLSAVLPSAAAVALSDYLPSSVLEMELRYAYAAGWGITAMGLVLSSFGRVMAYMNSKRHTNDVRLSAVTKLLSPLLVGVSSFILPTDFVRDHTRSVSIAAGLLFSLITKKVIVFSMAKMTLASIQWDIVPFVLACLWIRFVADGDEGSSSLLMNALCVFHAARLVVWARGAIQDICRRLDIWCFRIKPKKG